MRPATMSIAQAAASPGRTPLKSMNILTHQERKVVMGLRIAGAPDDQLLPGERQFFAALPEDLRTALATLASEARAEGLAGFAPGSVFVSEDEFAIICHLILLQRPSVTGSWQAINTFQHALMRCADLLSRRGRRLPPRTAMAEGNIDRQRCFNFGRLAYFADHLVDDEATPSWSPRRNERPHGSLKARALALVHAQGAVRLAQFAAIGVSHRYVRLLCNRGHLERIERDIYGNPHIIRELEPRTL